MADDNQKSRNILENSNFLKHRCCLEDRAFLSNSIELVQRENFLALISTYSIPFIFQGNGKVFGNIEIEFQIHFGQELIIWWRQSTSTNFPAKVFPIFS